MRQSITYDITLQFQVSVNYLSNPDTAEILGLFLFPSVASDVMPEMRYCYPFLVLLHSSAAFGFFSFKLIFNLKNQVNLLVI